MRTEFKSQVMITEFKSLRENLREPNLRVAKL